MIGIIDYGLGNLSSVYNAFKKETEDVEIFNNPHLTKSYSKIILPGVGSFSTGMDFLQKQGWVKEIKNHVASGKYILGICLGMQLLFTVGEENGETDGLKIIDGSVKKMDIKNDLKLPHVGWNNLLFKNNHHIFDGIKSKVDFYFVHSYACFVSDKNNILAEFNYGDKNFTACVYKDNVIGTQFHPEKSLPSGLKLIKNFVSLKDYA